MRIAQSNDDPTGRSGADHHASSVPRQSDERVHDRWWCKPISDRAQTALHEFNL
jgi:hypothetical protein